MEIACSLQKDCDAEDYGIFNVVMYLTKLKTWLLKWWIDSFLHSFNKYSLQASYRCSIELGTMGVQRQINYVPDYWFSQAVNENQRPIWGNNKF